MEIYIENINKAAQNLKFADRIFLLFSITNLAFFLELIFEL